MKQSFKSIMKMHIEELMIELRMRTKTHSLTKYAIISVNNQ